MDQLRVGLVGAGGISGVHVDGWRRLGASISIYAKQGAQTLADSSSAAVVSSFESLLDHSDVIDIVTPTPSHLDYALEALRAGRSVVCEKPLARSVDDAVRMAAEARRSPGRLLPAHVVRYFPEYAAARKAVREGRIGDLAVLRFSRLGAAPAPDSWFFDEELSGGLIMDQMIHDLDQARWIAGDVIEVYAVQSPRPRTGLRPERVAAQVVLTHRSGAISFVQGAWGGPATTFATSFSLAGRDGVLEHDSTRSRTFQLDGTVAEGYLPDANGGVSPYSTEIADFARAIRGGGDPDVSVEDGVIAVALADAAAVSVREGRSVAVSEAEILDRITRMAQKGLDDD